MKIYGINVRSVAWGTPYTEKVHDFKDYERIRDWGFNTVRLQLPWMYFTPNSPTVEETYFTVLGQRQGQPIDTLVSWCDQLGLYFIPSIRFGIGSPWYPPPTWAFPGITDPKAQWTALLDGSAPNERKSITDSIAFLVARYGGKSTIVPNPLNEPNIGNLTTAVAAPLFKAWMEEIIDAIRAAGYTGEILLDPLYGSDYSELLDVNRSDIIWDDHIYEPGNWDTPYDSATDLDALRSAIEWSRTYLAQRWGKPIFYGEFGKSLQPPVTGADDWFRDFLTIIKEYDLYGWTFHEYSRRPTEEMSIVLPDGTPIEPYLSILQAEMPTPTPVFPLGIPILTTAVGTGVGYLVGKRTGAAIGAAVGATLGCVIQGFRQTLSPAISTICAKCGRGFTLTTRGIPVWCPYCGEEQIVKGGG